MPVPRDTALYERIKREVKRSRHDWPSAYASMELTRRYVKAGGTYYGSKRSDTGTKKWLRERWVQVEPFVRDGVSIPCGERNNGVSCRPSMRIDSQTPLLVQEAVKKHGTKKVLSLARSKRKNMLGRTNWKKGVHRKSSNRP